MEDKLKNLNEKMNSTILDHLNFDASNKQQVFRKINNEHKRIFSRVNRTLKYVLSASVSTALLAGIAFFAFNQLTPLNNDKPFNLEKKLVVSKPANSIYTPEKKEEYFGVMTKEEILTKMINSIDYFTTAKGEFEESVQKNNKIIVKYELSMEGEIGGFSEVTYFTGSKEHPSTKKTYYDNQKIWIMNKDEDTYKESGYTPPSKCCSLSIESAFSTDSDGVQYTSTRDRPPIGIASNSLFPYEIASNYTRHLERWEIEKQNEKLLSHNTVVLQGTLDAYASEKSRANTFRFWVDKDTGILIQYETYNENGDVTSYLRPKQLLINIPIDADSFKPQLSKEKSIENHEDEGNKKTEKISEKVNKEQNTNSLDQQIKEKVAELGSKFKVGMNQDEMDQAFGKEFKLVKNPDIEDGTVEDRKYVFFEKEHTTTRLEYEVDFENFEKRNLGVQFFIGLNKDGKAQRASIVYIQGKDVMLRFISETGDRVEKINQ